MFLPVHYLQHVPESFWTESLLQVAVVCCLRPTRFDVGDVSLTDSLSIEVCYFRVVLSLEVDFVQALKCLKALSDHLPPKHKSQFLDIVKAEVAPEGLVQCISCRCI